MLGEEGGKGKEGKFHEMPGEEGGAESVRLGRKKQDSRKGATCTPIHRNEIEQETLQTLIRAPPHPMPTLEIKEYETGCEPLPTLCQLVFFFIEPIPPSPPLCPVK